MGLKIPRQGLHLSIIISAGLAAVYALSPTYDEHGAGSLEGVLKAQLKARGIATGPEKRAETNEAIKAMLERSKRGEFDAVVTPLWNSQHSAAQTIAPNVNAQRQRTGNYPPPPAAAAPK
jgi:hypothetical protein